MKYTVLVLMVLFLFTACTSKEEKTQWLLNKQESNLVFVKGGSFMMGDFGAIRIKDEHGYYLPASPENQKKYPNERVGTVASDKDALPVHKVTLSDFYMSKHLVTWEEFDAYYDIIGKNLFKEEAIGKVRWREKNYSAAVPSWQDAKNYCKFLAKHSGKNYDLPTEAQWEYAARSGGKYVYYGTDNGRAYNKFRSEYRPYDQNMMSSLIPIGTYPSNPLGLYDISGSGWQWVNDWYDEKYYKNSPALNPQGPKKGEKKVIRGGSGKMESVVFNRFFKPINEGYTRFRCVLNP